MIAKPIKNKEEKKAFFTFPDRLYKGNKNFRATEESLTRMLINGPTKFHTHTRVTPCLLYEKDKIAGRFAFFFDKRLPEFLQVGFFEALPDLEGVAASIIKLGKSLGTPATKILFGINGHLNYGAGILLNKFDEPPVFGFPYSPSYYPQYFKDVFCRKCVSFRFPLYGIYNWTRRVQDSFNYRDISVRFFRKNDLKKEIDIYTQLDNASFAANNTYYWSDRDTAENLELFMPFRHLLKKEHLLFAEIHGKPIGFLLWYPDFNGLVRAGKEIGLLELIRYKIANPLKVIRLAEVAILPEYQNSPAVAAMYLKSLPILEKAGYEICEGGFIFQENVRSMVMTQRYIERGLGYKMDPYRKFGIFEAEL